MQETTHLRLRFDQVPHQMITIWLTANGTDRLMCWQTAPVSSRRAAQSVIWRPQRLWCEVKSPDKANVNPWL